MLITRKSPLTGQDNTREIDCTEAQYYEWLTNPRLLIQQAMPDVPAEDREFIISGYTPEDFNILFPPDTEE